jgi:RHS repeat-associated protein
MIRKSHLTVLALATASALLSAHWVTADVPPCQSCVAYDPNHPGTTPIIMTGGPKSLRVGDPFPFDSSSFSDVDWVWGICPQRWDCNDPAGCLVNDTAVITKVWLCKPCGLFITLNADGSGGAQTIAGWVADEPGVYHARVTVENAADSPYCDDLPQEFELTFMVQGASDCPTCDGPQRDRFRPRANAGFDSEGIFVQFALGTHADGKSAGAIELRAKEPGPSLATPKALHYAISASDIEVIQDPNDPATLRQILTPQLLANIETIGTYYEIGFYSHANVGAKDQNGLYTFTGTAFKSWVVENTVADPYELDVTEYVDGSPRVGYDYVSQGGADWDLMRVDPNSGSAVLQTESVWWVTAGQEKDRYYTVADASNQEVYRELGHFASVDWGSGSPYWYPVERRVDPNGENLTTSWTYDANNGFALQSEQRPDGSWTWYQSTMASGEWDIEEISGWKDASYPSTCPSPSDPTVRSVVLRYVTDHAARLSSVEEKIAGFTVRESTYGYDDPNHPLAGVTEHACQDPSCGSYLNTKSSQWNSDPDRLAYMEYADGRRDAYYYDDVIAFYPPSNPSTSPAGWDLSQNDGQGYHYRQVLHGALVGGVFQTVAYQSTLDVAILDAAGHPVFEGAYVCISNDPNAVIPGTSLVSWTNRLYDPQGRLIDTYELNGAHEHIAYDSCCTETVTDRTGITTTYESDLLSRIATVTRGAIDPYGTYPAQSAIVTDYDYSTAFKTFATVSAGSLPHNTTVREYDGAKRLKSVTTNYNTAGALKTLYEYGTTGDCGLTVTTYHDYPATATVGTAGLRDEIAEHYCDGQIKSITGSLVIPTYYDYSAGSGFRETVVGTLALPSDPPAATDRYVRTSYDMLGRVTAVTRPGWSQSGAVELTTFYDYGSDGLLSKVSPPGRAPTLYAYDAFGHVVQSVLDANGNGNIDLGGPDRITESYTQFEKDASQYWWQVTDSSVYQDGHSTATPTGSQWTRLTGFGAGVVRESKSVDIFGNTTDTKTTVDSVHALATDTTTYPDSWTSEVQTRHGGRLVKSVSKTNVSTTYGYDDLGRRVTTTDGRSITTTTHYDDAGRVDWTKDGALNETDYVYYAATGASPGRLYYVQNPSGKKTYYAYNDRGQTTYRWGDVPQPTWTEYDSYGQRQKLHTYRATSPNWAGTTWPTDAGNGDATTWGYDAATGLLERKTYADDQHVDYGYTADGKLDVRTWARGVTADYDYDGSTADLTGVTYANEDPNYPTPPLSFQYDRLGRRTVVTDAAGTRAYAYDPNDLEPTTESFTSGMFSGKQITQLYQVAGTGVPGRFAGVQVGTSGIPNQDYAAAYSYDYYTGRLAQVSGPGLPVGGGTNNGAFYMYLSGSDLVKITRFRDDNATILARSWRQYESSRDLLDYLDNTWRPGGPAAVLSKYDYTNDNLGRRTNIFHNGVAFGSPVPPVEQTASYHDRNELTLSSRAGTSWGYTYDAIGNRTYSRTWDDPNDPNVAYISNELNQYERWDRETGTVARERYTYDADGNLVQSWVAGDMNCDGVVDAADINLFTAAISCAYAYPICCEQCWANEGHTCPYMNADINGDGSVSMADINPFVALETSHNAAVARVYTWDGENRLIGVTPAAPLAGSQRVEFSYDYVGRRVEKRVYNWDADPNNPHWYTTPATVRRFVWSGWLMLLELDGLSDNAVIRKYAWGLDLAGQMGAACGRPIFSRSMLERAGGIGGLLAMEDMQDPNDPNDSLNYAYLYDANGNVGQLIDWAHDPNDPAAAIVAKYEYDPYGNVTAQSGSYAADNPFRFSTKYWDDETGLGYWDQRFYNPALGRWLNRDPIGELGGPNLYAYVGNDPVDRFDALGQMWALCPNYPNCPGQDKPCPGKPTTQPKPPVVPPDPNDPELQICQERCEGAADYAGCMDQCLRGPFIGPKEPEPPPPPPPGPWWPFPPPKPWTEWTCRETCQNTSAMCVLAAGLSGNVEALPACAVAYGACIAYCALTGQ